MGRMLGVFDNDEELDRPDLNKCPDCGCFFAQDDCPLCGKPCPEEMRAGRRPAVKVKKNKGGSDSGRVMFIEWYHSWWFIAIMMFIFPIAGIVLLITSPHKKRGKVIFASLAAVYLVISTIGLGRIISVVGSMLDDPVDDSLTKDEYIAACIATGAEEFYRSPEEYKGEFIAMELKVISRAEYWDDLYYDSGDVYYVCEAPEGSSYKIIIRDCFLDGSGNLITGDVITVWGEGAKEITVYDSEYMAWSGPSINVAYVVSEE